MDKFKFKKPGAATSISEKSPIFSCKVFFIFLAKLILSNLFNFAKTKQILLYGFNKFLNLKKDNKYINRFFFKNFLFLSIFKVFLYVYINTTYCYSHTFPKKYFKDLTDFQVYDISIKLPSDIEGFLAFRYGDGWKIKDQNYNQQGKWKKAQARKKQCMNFIPMPAFRK